MEIKRDIIATLKAWKDSPHHKPILLRGARQIGKTWTMEAFGREFFEHVAVFDFDQRPELKAAFTVSKEPTRVIQELSLYCDEPIIAGKTLIISHIYRFGLMFRFTPSTSSLSTIVQLLPG